MKEVPRSSRRVRKPGGGATLVAFQGGATEPFADALVRAQLRAGSGSKRPEHPWKFDFDLPEDVRRGRLMGHWADD